MSKNYDLIVIGWGKAGKTLAAKSAAKGKKVAIIEEKPKMYGGTCINVGCLPTKSLVHSSKILEEIKSYGIDGDYDFKNKYFVEAMKKKDELTKKLRTKNFNILDNNENVDIYNGKGSFVSNTEVKISTAKGDEIITGSKIVINTGAVTRTLPTEGAENNANVLTSEEILELNKLPKKLLIVGAGYIGLEFASYFSNFGTEVTVFQFDNSFLVREDEDEAQIEKEILEKKGVKFLFNTSVKIYVNNVEDVKVIYTTDGQEKEEIFDKVLVAVGRVPNTKNLGLENTSVQVGKFGEIVVDDYLRTTAENIFAVGDVKGGPQFTYVSLDDFRIVFPQIIENATPRRVSDRKFIPTSTFIDPPYSRVGINEKEAQRLGIKYTKKFALTNTIPKAHVINQTEGFTKILINENDEIIGASICHYESHEMINLLSLAIDLRIKSSYLKNFIYTHPNFTESLNDILG